MFIDPRTIEYKCARTCERGLITWTGSPGRRQETPTPGPSKPLPGSDDELSLTPMASEATTPHDYESNRT